MSEPESQGEGGGEGGGGERRRWYTGERAPFGQLGPQAWLDWPETRAVVAALTTGGAEVRFVGGCVRDALAHRPVADIDLATPEPPETVLARLEAAGIRAVPTGLAHGTVTAVIAPRRFEITTLRVDVQTDGRHAVVAWSSDWMADAARRDFTINALSARPDGAVFDYFDGIDDLAHHRVRFIGRAVDRIREDHLRILRYFRFLARYGRPPRDPDALAACTLLAPSLRQLSGERVREEMLKILATDTAADVLVAMRGARVLAEVLPEADDLGRLRQLVFLETRGLKLTGIAPDPLRRLAACLPAWDGAAAETVAGRLRLSNAATHRLALMTAAPPPDLDAVAALAGADGARRLPAILRAAGREAFIDRLLLAWAGWRAVEGRTASTRSAALIAVLEAALAWEAPVFTLRGRDLLDLGVRAGPGMGHLLRALETWWEAGGCQADHAALLAEARRRLASPTGNGPTGNGTETDLQPL